MLDLLSGSRLDLGAERGGTEQETSLCGVDRERATRKAEEALRIIGTPLFLACSRTETLTQAAELGIGALVMGFAGPEAIAGMRQPYDAAIAARTDARRVGSRGQRFSAQSIGHWYGGAGVPDEAVVEGGDEATRMREAAEQAVARLHEQDIPVPPTSTTTFNADHAYGTADDALSAAFPDLGDTVTDAVEARRVLAASPAHRKPPPPSEPWWTASPPRAARSAENPAPSSPQGTAAAEGYLMLDAAQDPASFRENPTGCFPTAAHLRRSWRYLDPDGDGAHPLASPLRAADLPVTGRHWPSMFHGYPGFPTPPPEADEALNDVAEAIASTVKDRKNSGEGRGGAG
ncbi:hypothetical protein [Streptomyces huasconensis]|uniref:hypothetical protein n=1 Tax=Streptomyces huasconensis TaxID=1854574 RepID=UPI0036FC6294